MASLALGAFGSQEVATSIPGGLLLARNFPSGAVWDLKPYLDARFGLDGVERTLPSSGQSIRQDVYGNVAYGYMLSTYGVSQEVAILSSNQGGADFGRIDAQDDVAIAISYQLAAAYPNGFSSEQYLSFLLANGAADIASR